MGVGWDEYEESLLMNAVETELPDAAEMVRRQWQYYQDESAFIGGTLHESYGNLNERNQTMFQSWQDGEIPDEIINNNILPFEKAHGGIFGSVNWDAVGGWANDNLGTDYSTEEEIQEHYRDTFKKRREELQIKSQYATGLQTAAGFAGSMAGVMSDAPAWIAMSVAAALPGGQATSATMAVRLLRSLAVGAGIEIAEEAILFQPVVAMRKREIDSPYDKWDYFANVAMGGGIGAGLGLTVGIAKEFLGGFLKLRGELSKDKAALQAIDEVELLYDQVRNVPEHVPFKEHMDNVEVARRAAEEPRNIEDVNQSDRVDNGEDVYDHPDTFEEIEDGFNGVMEQRFDENEVKIITAMDEDGNITKEKITKHLDDIEEQNRKAEAALECATGKKVDGRNDDGTAKLVSHEEYQAGLAKKQQAEANETKATQAKDKSEAAKSEAASGTKSAVDPAVQAAEARRAERDARKAEKSKRRVEKARRRQQQEEDNQPFNKVKYISDKPEFAPVVLHKKSGQKSASQLEIERKKVIDDAMLKKGKKVSEGFSGKPENTKGDKGPSKYMKDTVDYWTEQGKK